MSAEAANGTYPEPWPTETVAATGIGPGHPNHPAYREHYTPDGQPLPGGDLERRIAESIAQFALGTQVEAGS